MFGSRDFKTAPPGRVLREPDVQDPFPVELEITVHPPAQISVEAGEDQPPSDFAKECCARGHPSFARAALGRRCQKCNASAAGTRTVATIPSTPLVSRTTKQRSGFSPFNTTGARWPTGPTVPARAGRLFPVWRVAKRACMGFHGGAVFFKGLHAAPVQLAQAQFVQGLLVAPGFLYALARQRRTRPPPR